MKVLWILLVTGISQSSGHFQLPHIDLGPNPLGGILVGVGQAVKNAGESLHKINPGAILHDVKHKVLGIPHRPPPQHHQPPPQEVPKAPPPPQEKPATGPHGGYPGHGQGQGGYYPNQGYQGYPGYPNNQGYPHQGYPNQGYPGGGYGGQSNYPGYNQNQGYPGYPQNYPNGQYGQNQPGGNIHNLGGSTGTQGFSTVHPGQNTGHGGHGVFQGQNYPNRPQGYPISGSTTPRPFPNQGYQPGAPGSGYPGNVGYPGGSTPKPFPNQGYQPNAPGTGYPSSGGYPGGSTSKPFPNQGYQPGSPGSGYPSSGGQSNVPYKPVVEGNVGESSYPGQNIFGGNKPTGNKPSYPTEGGEFGNISFGQSSTTNPSKDWSSETFGGQGNIGGTNYGKNEGNTGGNTPTKGTEGMKSKEELIFDPETEIEGEYSFDLRMSKPK